MQKTSIITGGAKGIGKEISNALAEQGWNLCLIARDEKILTQVADDLEKSFGVKVKGFAYDLSQLGEIDSLLEQCFYEFDNEITSLVCNSGNYGKLGSFGSVSFDEWKQSFDLNFFSAARIAQVFIQKNLKLKVTQRKKITFMCGAGIGGAKVWGGMSAYSISKAALYRLTETLHAEYFDHGFDVNAIAPGAVDTTFVDQALEVGEPELGETFKMIQNIRKSGGESPKLAGDMIARLHDQSCHGVSGRLLSAKWDVNWLKEEKIFQLSNDPDLFRLRRIDHSLFGKKP